MIERGVVIEEARLEDVPGIVEAHAKSFVDTYVGVTPEATEEALRFHVDSRQFRLRRSVYLAQVVQGSKNAAVFVAREGDEILGFSGARVDPKGVSRMDGLYVVRQGVGIGSELFHRAIDWQEPGRDIFLTVALNTPAVTFHSKFGFKDTGVRSVAKLQGDLIIPIKEMKLAAQDRRSRR